MLKSRQNQMMKFLNFSTNDPIIWEDTARHAFNIHKLIPMLKQQKATSPWRKRLIYFFNFSNCHNTNSFIWLRLMWNKMQFEGSFKSGGSSLSFFPSTCVTLLAISFFGLSFCFSETHLDYEDATQSNFIYFNFQYNFRILVQFQKENL